MTHQSTVITATDVVGFKRKPTGLYVDGHCGIGVFDETVLGAYGPSTNPCAAIERVTTQTTIFHLPD